MSEQALQNLAQIFYLVSAALFILGLKGMTKVKSARRGNGIAAVGMLLAIIGTLIEAGRIVPAIGKTYRLEEAVVAHRAFEAGEIIGRAVLTI